MTKSQFKSVFLQTLPVFAGYVSLGIAFGILLEKAGYGFFWALAMSVCIFAGSAQFLCVSLLAAHAPFPSVALLVFLLNFRHFFYGLSMIARYRGMGAAANYLIFALTDETYALLSTNKVPEGVKPKKYYLMISGMNQSYWVLGSLIGNVAGRLITFDTTGLDFAMTALFAVLVVEQWKSNRKHAPAWIGALVTIISLYILGPDNFLIPALVVICVILLLFQKYLKEEKKDESVCS